MKISKRGEYGLRAMIYLASNSESGFPIQIKEVSEHEKIPFKYLEQILLSLKNVGLLQSKSGVGGGYYLSRPPELITLGEIIRILDGPIAPVRCVSQTAYESCNCPDEANCDLRRVMLDVRNAISDIVDHTSLQDVIRKT
jgi:Rrf2 family protein